MNEKNQHLAGWIDLLWDVLTGFYCL